MQDRGEYIITVITLDRHIEAAALTAQSRLERDFPGLKIVLHAACEWEEDHDALEDAKASIMAADMVLCSVLFLESQVAAILPTLKARRDRCDGILGIVSASQIVSLTKLGGLDMQAPASGILSLLKKLRGGSKTKPASGERQLAMLRRIPKILRLIPGKAQDLRTYFLAMQYWLSGSAENIEGLIRMLLARHCRHEEWRGGDVPPPIHYPEVGLYHPDCGVIEDRSALPARAGPKIGLLLMRPYILSKDTAHYDAVIRAFEEKGMQVIPAYAGGLDARPAIARYFDDIDALVSLTGFSLVGGPAFNDSQAAIEALRDLNMPYLAAHPLEFQTLEQWRASERGLGPVETTMLVALPELDGATNPTVFAGRHTQTRGDDLQAMTADPERVATLAEKSFRLAKLRRIENKEKRVGIVLFGFPPNAGAVGTAAYLDVFKSLFNTLSRMKDEGYDVDLPESVEALREAVLKGNSEEFGQEANVFESVSAEAILKNTPFLSEIEAQWGPAPGRIQSDGRGVHILGAKFGKVFVGVQPSFGYEGDPMRLLFEKGFAPTHAFAQFYLWLRNAFAADVILHFGMHGALEFMPGKQNGLSGADWPDRLIGALPNVYLYAANNPSEASLAKRRINAVTVTHLTPPLSTAGLYRGYLDLKDTLTRYRTLEDGGERAALEPLIMDQAAAVDLEGSAEELWLILLETEAALITEGLHIVGEMTESARENYLKLIADQAPEQRDHAAASLSQNSELDGLMSALSAHYIPPVAGGDIIRNVEILPTGRNIHAFDPFRMPTAYASQKGEEQAELLLEAHSRMPRSVAMVLWGSDNIKSDGMQLAQAMALIGARPRFDAYGRLADAELIPLEALGRPRVDVVITLSGIFRDLLPLQTKLLADACYKAASADEPLSQNFIRAHALAYSEKMGVDLETAALRVFSNAEGAYGSNVNQLIDSAAWAEEAELANTFKARKSFAYGRNGKSSKHLDLLEAALRDVDLAYQNLESVELGVTTVDHYFDTLGGISQAVKDAKGVETPVYIGDQTRGQAKVRTLADQVSLESRTRSLNPKFYEGLMKHGSEGVRQIEAQITNTMGWSATTGQVDPRIYQRLTETFVLDETMKRRLAELNPTASAKMASRLLEAHERNYWTPDEATLCALREGVEHLEDALEGVVAGE